MLVVDGPSHFLVNSYNASKQSIWLLANYFVEAEIKGLLPNRCSFPKGKRAKAGIFLASTDRVATDAVGVAILKALGSNEAIMRRKIFEQDQIKRAGELGLGAGSPSEIDMLADEKRGEHMNKIVEILKEG
jgi:uncharacterized protein (DUF362 family)